MSARGRRLASSPCATPSVRRSSAASSRRRASGSSAMRSAERLRPHRRGRPGLAPGRPRDRRLPAGAGISPPRPALRHGGRTGERLGTEHSGRVAPRPDGRTATPLHRVRRPQPGRGRQPAGGRASRRFAGGPRRCSAPTSRPRRSSGRGGRGGARARGGRRRARRASSRGSSPTAPATRAPRSCARGARAPRCPGPPVGDRRSPRPARARGRAICGASPGTRTRACRSLAARTARSRSTTDFGRERDWGLQVEILAARRKALRVRSRPTRARRARRRRRSSSVVLARLLSPGPAAATALGKGASGGRAPEPATRRGSRRPCSTASTSPRRSRANRCCASRPTARSATGPGRDCRRISTPGEKVTLTVYPEDGAPVTVYADRANYDERSRESKLMGNVRWTDTDGSLAETRRGAVPSRDPPARGAREGSLHPRLDGHHGSVREVRPQGARRRASRGRSKGPAAARRAGASRT